MGKRKLFDASTASVPMAIKMQPIDPVESQGGGDHPPIGPFAVYFPSGFQPDVDADCTWRVFRHRSQQGHFVVVASTDTVDFVGSSDNAECTGPLPCR